MVARWWIRILVFEIALKNDKRKSHQYRNIRKNYQKQKKTRWDLSVKVPLGDSNYTKL